MDVLSDVLGALKLLSTLYFTTEFSPPWGVQVPGYQRVARFHVVLRGHAWAGVGSDESVRLESGDVVVVPHGAEHRLSDAPETPCVALDRVVEQAGFRGEGPLVIPGDATGSPARLLCGHFGFDESLEHPLLSRLPSMIVVRRDGTVRAEMEDLIRFIDREARTSRPGDQAVLRRLSEVLFIQAVRAWAESDPLDENLLAALADAHVHRSLCAIHGDVAKPWTVETLARAAGLSRTAFCDRFRRLVGMPPFEYLTFWRMQIARDLLADPSLTVETVANEVGYESLPAFSRAFKRHAGAGPGAYRRARSAAA